MSRFATSRGVPAVDLLSLLAEALTREGATAEDYFIDKSHLSVRGSQVVAELLTPRIRSLVEAP